MKNDSRSAGRRGRSDDSSYPPDGGEKRKHKTAALCRQVERTVSATLATLGDEALLDLSVIEVRPCPDAGHLLVLLHLPSSSPATPMAASLALTRARGKFRADIAESVTRKRIPELSFQVCPRVGLAMGVDDE